MNKKILINLFAILIPLITYAQTNEIAGKITDAVTGEPLIGANVIIKGTTKGTITDYNGEFTLSVTPEDFIEIRYVGYITEEFKVGNQTQFTINLDQDTQSLEEVVVIGYGRVKKSDLTGSVSSVRGVDLIKIQSVSPEQALQGRVAGVRVTSNSGAPGDAPTVRIRGVGTFGNPDPIFVVDGVILNDITYLNSADIESMEVLKDASSTAMYGSRGANGVIIITTKSGSFNDKANIQFVANYELQTIQKYVDMLDARQFATALNQIMPGTFNNLNLLENTDWQKEVYRSYAPVQNYQLSVSGGAEKSRYYASFGYYNQEGIIPGSSYDRISVKVNNDYKPIKNLHLGHNLTFSTFNKENAPDIVASTLRAWPTDPAYNDDGTFYGNRGNGNPVASIEYTNNTKDGIRGVGNFYGEYTFLNHFTFRSSFGLDLEYYDEQSFTPVFFVTSQQYNDETRLSKNRYSKENWLWENTLNYHFEANDHNIDILAGYTAQEDNTEGLKGEGRNLLRDEILYLSNDLTDIQIENTATIKSMVSYLFRANYVYKNRYLLTSTFRRDGSSAFSQENRWGNFPSFAAGWRVSEEPFFTSAIVNNLKLRGSWGIVGNDKVETDERYTLISNEQGAVFGTDEALYAGSTYGTTGNPLVRWEEAIQTNVGAEIGFLRDKLVLEIDYYRKVTKDILIDLPLPGHAGNGSFTYVKFNAADVLNTGLEYALTWRGNSGSLFYEISTNGSTVRNEVTKMGDDTGADNFLPLGNLGNGQNVKRVAVGQSIGYFYGYKVAGVFQNEDELEMYPKLSLQDVGDFRYEDVNNDGEITTDDRTYIGSSTPDFIFGLSTNVSYRGLSLSLDFQGELGREIYDGKDAVRTGQYNYQARVANAWNGEGTSNSEPRVSSGGVNYSQSDWFIYDGSFFRLRNITLGYDLPSTILEKISVQRATIFLKGTNVFTLTKYTGYTPEIGGDVSSNGIDKGVYPVTSVYGIGVNLNF